jgi:hypothetical protein
MPPIFCATALGGNNSFATDEFSVGFVTDATNGSSTFLEVGPTLVMRLGLVDTNCIGTFIHLIEPKFVCLALVSQNIYKVERKAAHFTVSRKEMGAKNSKILRISINGMTHATQSATNSSDHLPKRMQPGSSRDLIALFSIIFKNSSMRSSLISASTMTENGLDDMLRAVFE